MPRINLLPWRAELRQRRKKEFLVALAGSLIVALGVVYLSKLTVQGWTSNQRARNAVRSRRSWRSTSGTDRGLRVNATASSHACHHAAAALASRGVHCSTSCQLNARAST
jgi:hypothetical protein